MKKILFSLPFLIVFGFMLIPFSYASQDACADLGEHNPIIVFANPKNYQLGDTVTAYGCTNIIIKGINVSILDIDGNIIQGGAVVPELQTNSSWSNFLRTFELDENFSSNKIYVIQAEANGIFSHFEFVVGNIPESIPEWIKNTATWWIQDVISDDEYLNAIQYLVNENIIKVTASTFSSNENKQVPTWIKTHAMYWTEGQMSDSEFLEGIKFLINNGIIKLKQLQDSEITIEFESNIMNKNSKFTVKIIDNKANVDPEFLDIASLTVSDGGPIQAGSTIMQYVMATETEINSGIFTFTGTVSDFVPTTGEIHAIYETDSKMYEAISLIGQLPDSGKSISFETLYNGSFGEIFEESWHGPLVTKGDFTIIFDLERAGVKFDIPFDKSKIPIAVFDEMYFSGGNSVTITDIILNDDIVNVSVLREFPGPDCIVTSSIEQPYHIVNSDLEYEKRVDYEFLFNFNEIIYSCN